jgi:hypothetical protein
MTAMSSTFMVDFEDPSPRTSDGRARAGRTDEAQTLAKKFRAKFPTGLFRAVVDGAAPDSFE